LNGFEHDPDERSFEDNLFGDRVRHNLSNIGTSLERPLWWSPAD